MFYVYANLFQIAIGYITTKLYHGRRILLIFGVILASIISELFLYFLRLFYENEALGEALENNDYIED